eukprot:9499853-Pyramimonas_sp.AAC.2
MEADIQTRKYSNTKCASPPQTKLQVRRLRRDLHRTPQEPKQSDNNMTNAPPERTTTPQCEPLARPRRMGSAKQATHLHGGACNPLAQPKPDQPHGKAIILGRFGLV